MEKDLIKKLKELKTEFNITAIKTEFESEGAVVEEVLLQKEISKNTEIDLVVKIGGCEAINDLYTIKQIGVNSIVSPMIESVYAFKKYIKACKIIFPDIKNKKLLINIETICGYKNIDEILKTKESNYLSGVVFGRSDMIGSLDLIKEDVNSEMILDYAKELSKKIQQKNKKFIVGGGINKDSVVFLQKIPYLTSFETRKIVFDSNVLNKSNIETGIRKALEFELLWLKNRQEKFNIVRPEDIKRIEMLEKQIFIGPSNIKNKCLL